LFDFSHNWQHQPTNLKCDNNHLQLTNTFVQFIPASLSKTDRASRIGPSICLFYSKNASLCPVAIIRTLLQERHALDIHHNCLFFNPRRPNSLVTLAIFKGFIERSLRDTCIDAPPRINARHGSVSALGRGASMANILHMGNWTNSSTLLRHYASL
jgi:hypothetical protein